MGGGGLNFPSVLSKMVGMDIVLSSVATSKYIGIWNSNAYFNLCLLYHLQLFKDLLHPSVEEEKRKHKLKRLVQSPNSYFMDVKCPGKSKQLLYGP